MRQTFQVQNVKCGGCSKTLKEKLREDFGDIEVDLEHFPRQISLEIDDERIKQLSEALKALGYPLVDEKMNFIETQTVKAKSFVSCAVGKWSE